MSIETGPLNISHIIWRTSETLPTGLIRVNVLGRSGSEMVFRRLGFGMAVSNTVTRAR